MERCLQVLVIVFHVIVSKQSVLMNEKQRVVFCCSSQVLILTIHQAAFALTKKCIILVVLKSSPGAPCLSYLTHIWFSSWSLS